MSTVRAQCRAGNVSATKEGDKKERDSGADQGPDDAVEALC
jgi:hypothetical protein